MDWTACSLTKFLDICPQIRTSNTGKCITYRRHYLLVAVSSPSTFNHIFLPDFFFPSTNASNTTFNSNKHSQVWKDKTSNCKVCREIQLDLTNQLIWGPLLIPVFMAECITSSLLSHCVPLQGKHIHHTQLGKKQKSLQEICICPHPLPPHTELQLKQHWYVRAVWNFLSPGFVFS